MSETTPPSRKPRVAIVFGGRSSEHVISCSTAGSVLQAIDTEKYDVVPIGIAQDGRWVLESGDPDRLRIQAPDRLPEVDGSRASVTLAPEAASTGLVVTEPAQPPRTLGDVDGRRVTLVEDVITTGGAVRDATRALRERGAVVEVVVCAIDRSPAGENPLADVGLEVRPVLTKAQLDAARG